MKTTPAIAVEPIYAEGRSNNGAWNAHSFRIATEAGTFTIARDGAEALRVEMGSNLDEVVGIFSAIGMRQQAYNYAASMRRHESAHDALLAAAFKDVKTFFESLTPSAEEEAALQTHRAAWEEAEGYFAPLKAVADAVTAVMIPSALDREAADTEGGAA